VAVALAAVAAALAVPTTASARPTPLGSQVRVIVLDQIPDGMFAALARRGAVGLLRPGVGATTSHRQALAELVRGAEVKARAAAAGHFRPRIGVEQETSDRFSMCKPCIVVALPRARGHMVANNKLFRIAVVGMGARGLLTSPRTRIPGLVSVFDIVPTTQPGDNQTTRISWIPTSHAVDRLGSLDHQVAANDRLKFAALFTLAGLILLLALFGLRAAVTAVPAALLINLLLGVTQVSNEVLLMAAIAAGTAALAFLLARLCRNDDALLLLFGGVVALYAVTMVVRPEWQAINPFGPTQNSRFWGVGNQLETLLLAPLLTGTVIAQRRFGLGGFLAFGAFGLLVLTDNRLGADGGGAITLGVALAVLGWRLFRLRFHGLVALLASAAIVVLWVVSRGLMQPGPNHLRHAFFGNGLGLLKAFESLVPLSYLPALHAWPMVVPLLLVCVATFTVAWRHASARASRDLLLALGVGLATSLLVNDSAAYELAGGIAVLAAVARFVPTSAPVRFRVLVPVLRRSALAREPVTSESPPS
jgi:hypothetical protein